MRVISPERFCCPGSHALLILQNTVVLFGANVNEKRSFAALCISFGKSQKKVKKELTNPPQNAIIMFAETQTFPLSFFAFLFIGRYRLFRESSVIICECAGTGRQARLRGVCCTTYGFKSRHSHQKADHFNALSI